MALEDQSIGELEVRIQLLNFTLNWLRSDDPMLTDPRWSQYVPGAIEEYEKQLHQVIEVCRDKKVKRDGDPNTDPVGIELKSAKMTNSARLGN
jgi:hypothetical protein